MDLDFTTILIFGAVFWVAFCLVGLFSLWMGNRRARSVYREKGFVRPPAGKHWFPFLLEKRYEAFDNPSIPFFFKISHFCLMAMLLIMAAVLLLVGVSFLLRNTAQP